MALADLANQYVDEEKPWELSKQTGSAARLQQVCSLAIDVFRLLTIYLKPVLPKLASDAERFLNLPPLQWRDVAGIIPDGHAINEYRHLLGRVEAKQLDQLFDAASVPQPAAPRGMRRSSSIKPRSRP